MHKLFLLSFIAFSFSVKAQPVTYRVSNAHSHNDYVNAVPFWTAYNEGFGSIEADIFLVDGVLLVAHDKKELVNNKRSLVDLYINPLIECLAKNKGYPFADTTKPLQLLIDIKSAPINTLQALIVTISKKELLVNSHKIKWVITGNRPDPSLFISYPPFISFDGELDKVYSPVALTRIALLSDACMKYTTWDGRGKLSANDLQKLQEAIAKSHNLHKPVRFWAAPDMINAWSQLMQLKVDYINTDHIHELAAYISLRAK